MLSRTAETLTLYAVLEVLTVLPVAMSLTIRSARPQDIGTLVSFNQSLAQEIQSQRLELQQLTQGVQAVLTDPSRGFYTVVEKDGRIVAAALVTFEWSDWRDAWFWWIQDVYVDPGYRQQGIYRTLYTHLRTQAQAAKVCGLRLYVYKGNVRAQEVYRRLGMVPSQSELFEENLSYGTNPEG